MSFTVTNNANAPVHVRVMNAGITYFHKNYLAPGESVSFNPAAVWYDVVACYASKETEIAEGDNSAAIGGWVTTGLGILGMLAGVVLFLVPGGQPAGGLLIATAMTSTFGVVTTVGSVAFQVLQGAHFPASVQGCYGGNDLTFEVTGKISVEPDPQHSNEFVITGASPISVHWANAKANTNGSVTGASVELPFLEPLQHMSGRKRSISGFGDQSFLHVDLKTKAIES